MVMMIRRALLIKASTASNPRNTKTGDSNPRHTKTGDSNPRNTKTGDSNPRNYECNGPLIMVSNVTWAFHIGMWLGRGLPIMCLNELMNKSDMLQGGEKYITHKMHFQQEKLGK